MDLGGDVWLTLGLVLPLLALVVFLLLRQRVQKVEVSKYVRWAGIIVGIAIVAIYLVWNQFFRH